MNLLAENDSCLAGCCGANVYDKVAIDPSWQVLHKGPRVAVPVAFCITELDPGGAERALFEIVTRLNPAEWTVKVFCLGPETDLSRRLRQQGIATICLGARGARDIGVLFRLIRELKAFRPVVLQTFLFHANILGRIAGWWAGVPIILSGLRVAEHAQRWHLWLDRITNWMVTSNVCVSEGVRRFAQMPGGLSAQKLCVIPNGVDADRYAHAQPVNLNSLGIPDGAWTLVTVGRLTHQKSHDLLLEAVAPLMAEYPQLHLLIVGEGPERNALTDQAAQLGIDNRVHLPGWQADIPGILKSSQAFVLPSRWEGMPNALLEALASGLPCIATEVEGVSELMRDGESGKMVTPGDVSAMRMAVKQVLSEDCLPRNKTTQSHAIKRHSWDLIAAQYAELFRSVLP